MQFDLDVAHALHEQMTAWQQLVPVSVRRKRDAVEAAVRLEACFVIARTDPSDDPLGTRIVHSLMRR